MSKPKDCLDCGVCESCIERSIAANEATDWDEVDEAILDGDEQEDVCDYCNGTGIDEAAKDDGTEDYDTCPICGGME